MKSISISIIVLIIFCACTQKKARTYKEQIEMLVAEWINQTMVLPQDLQAKVQGRDTVCDALWERPYRILIPIDLLV